MNIITHIYIYIYMFSRPGSPWTGQWLQNASGHPRARPRGARCQARPAHPRNQDRRRLGRHQTCDFRARATSVPTELGGKIHNASGNRARIQVLVQARKLHVYGSGTFGAFWAIKIVGDDNEDMVPTDDAKTKQELLRKTRRLLSTTRLIRHAPSTRRVLLCDPTSNKQSK